MSTQPNSEFLKNAASVQPPRRIVIQGVRGAFHEIAAREFFGKQIEVVPAMSFSELFEKTADPATADAAVMAIENSIAGSLLGNYNLLQTNCLQIIGEVFLPIRQNLLALPGVPISEIREVHSHPIALAQCKDFFKKHPKIRLVESEDTAVSAERIRKKRLKHAAAVASSLAAELYDLKILAPAIETNHQNFTRFLALLPRPQAQAISRADKVSVSFSTPHEVGSLAKILKILADRGANLTKIQSVPILGKPWEYLFFVDFVVSESSVLPQILPVLEKITHDLTVFGIYKSVTPTFQSGNANPPDRKIGVTL